MKLSYFYLIARAWTLQKLRIFQIFRNLEIFNLLEK